MSPRTKNDTKNTVNGSSKQRRLTHSHLLLALSRRNVAPRLPNAQRDAHPCIRTCVSFLFISLCLCFSLTNSVAAPRSRSPSTDTAPPRSRTTEIRRAARFVLELCQVRSSLLGEAPKEMVLAFNKLREAYRISTDRDRNLEEVGGGGKV